MEYSLFTSESVSEGHPDKIADQISDAILDEILKDDPSARVAIETMVKTGMVIVSGEVRTTTYVDIEDTVRNVVKKIGYDHGDLGFDGESVAVINSIGKQSTDIAIGVDKTLEHELGAGDQGLMFGYANNETPVLMPAPIYYAHKLVKKQATLRKNGTIPWLRPDAKSQVTLKYDKNFAVQSVDAVVLSTQHDPGINYQHIKQEVLTKIIKPCLPEKWITKDTKFHINPTGNFVIGGPVGDCGLTGRKIIVDTYGGMARHGGGAFSGKDPSKVDRSAAYAARYIAKNVVAAGLAKKCEIQISYAIGVCNPTSISINTFNTGKISDNKLIKIIHQMFNLTPNGIIKMLDLQKPIYYKTAAYGHFGREDINFSWEKTDRVADLQEASQQI